MDSIRRVAASSLDAEPWRYLEVGQRAYIQDGPLEGVVGILVTIKNTNRIVLSVSLLRRAVAVEIDRDSVRPIFASHSEQVRRAPL
jgi:transcription antitermination factor NusG